MITKFIYIDFDSLKFCETINYYIDGAKLHEE